MNEADQEMLPQYDFTEGVRGKHYESVQSEHTIRILHSDGTCDEQLANRTPRMIALAPDVEAYFPNAESVNRALHGLIRLLPQHTKAP